MKTALVSVEVDIPTIGEDMTYRVLTLCVDIIDPDEPNRLVLVFCGNDTAGLPPEHPLYEDAKNLMLPPGTVFCSSWARAEELYKEFMKQARCPLDQVEVYGDKEYFPRSFQVLLGLAQPEPLITEDELKVMGQGEEYYTRYGGLLPLSNPAHYQLVTSSVAGRVAIVQELMEAGLLPSKPKPTLRERIRDLYYRILTFFM